MITHRLSRAIVLGVIAAVAMPGGALAALAAQDDAAIVLEDAQATMIDVLSNDSNGDADALTIVDAGDPSHGTVEIAGDGSSLTYQPEADYHGDDSFEYTVTLGANEDTATVTVTVTSVNDPPTARDDNRTVTEDASAATVNVLGNDDDPEGDDLTVTSVGTAQHGTTAISGDEASVTYEPNSNFAGTDSFTYTISDGEDEDTAAVQVTVTAVDDAPVAIDDEAVVPEDVTTPIDVLDNDTDVDGGAKVVQSKTNGTHGEVTIDADDLGVTYDPDPNFVGEDTFTYTLTGGSIGTVAIHITPSNDDPVAGPDSLSIPAGAVAVPVPVLANDTDVDGDPLAIFGTTASAKGQVVVAADGKSLTYKPFPGLFGADSFTYTVTDGHGGAAVGAVSVIITSGNHAPSAVNDAKSVPQGAGPTPLTILANDQDLDGNTLTITAKTNGEHGTVVITGGGTGLTYNPVNSFHGIDTFTYAISDGLASDSATVLITVVRDTAPPIVAAPAVRIPGQTVGSSTTKARLTWGATDPGSGIRRYKVQVSIDGKAWKTITLPKATSRTIAPSLRTGHTYRFRVRATDGEGNTSAYVKGPLLRPVRSSEASTKVTYVGAWAKTKTTKALGGATRHATSNAKRARFAFTAYDVGWIATRTTKSGKARIYLDGALVATIDLDRAKTTYRKLVFARHFATLGPHVLEIQPVGDGRVDIDGFVVLR